MVRQKSWPLALSGEDSPPSPSKSTWRGPHCGGVHSSPTPVTLSRLLRPRGFSWGRCPPPPDSAGPHSRPKPRAARGASGCLQGGHRWAQQEAKEAEEALECLPPAVGAMGKGPPLSTRLGSPRTNLGERTASRIDSSSNGAVQ